MRGKRKSESECRELCRLYGERDNTQEEFCSEHGIKGTTLNKYLVRFKRGSSFAPAQLEGSSIEGTIKLELPHGISLTIPR